MTREFLQNFKVGDAPLPKEVVDAIMEENGRDIEAAKKPFADYEAIKTQLQTATDGLKAFEGVDVKELQGRIAKLQGDLAAQKAEHEAQLADMAFDGGGTPPPARPTCFWGGQSHGSNLETPEELLRKIVRKESGGGDAELLQLLNALSAPAFDRNRQRLGPCRGGVSQDRRA